MNLSAGSSFIFVFLINERTWTRYVIHLAKRTTRTMLSLVCLCTWTFVLLCSFTFVRLFLFVHLFYYTYIILHGFVCVSSFKFICAGFSLFVYVRLSLFVYSFMFFNIQLCSSKFVHFCVCLCSFIIVYQLNKHKQTQTHCLFDLFITLLFSIHFSWYACEAYAPKTNHYYCI